MTHVKRVCLNKAEMACLVMEATADVERPVPEARLAFAMFEARYPEDAQLVKRVVDALTAYFVKQLNEAEDVQ